MTTIFFLSKNSFFSKPQRRLKFFAIMIGSPSISPHSLRMQQIICFYSLLSISTSHSLIVPFSPCFHKCIFLLFLILYFHSLCLSAYFHFNFILSLLCVFKLYCLLLSLNTYPICQP